MTDVIGWYAHHLGAGHVTRARLVAERMQTRVVILSSAPRPVDWPEDRWFALPTDDAEGGRDHDAGGAMHWAPLGHTGYGQRMALVADWLRAMSPALLVCDVSVEVAVLTRTLGVPVATVVMAGDRRDRPHRLAYDASSHLFAAWPREADVVRGWRHEWSPKTTWLSAFSRFDGLAPRPPPGAGRVTLLWGRGSAVDDAQLRAAVDATPGWTWTVCADPEAVWSALQSADVVVTHAGQNALAEVAAARRPAVVVPQPRPHDEQLALASALDGVAPVRVQVSWPQPGRWPALLEETARLDPARWARWTDGRGADRFAGVLDELAASGAA